jgi:hypothetical protein
MTPWKLCEMRRLGLGLLDYPRFSHCRWRPRPLLNQVQPLPEPLRRPLQDDSSHTTTVPR